MKFRNTTIAAAAAVMGITAMSHQAAAAEAGQELEVYAGASFGDRIADYPATGNALELDDNATFGARYTFWNGSRFGLQLAGGFTPTTIKYTQGGDVDVDVYTFDANVVVDLTPQLNVGGHKVQTYAAIGAGYALADADGPIVGAVGSGVKTLDDDGGFTANAGLGAKLYFTDSLYAGLDARYRYIDRLVKTDSHELSTIETTLSVGYRF
jgi:opacity protein-like surface antigen